MRTIIFADYPLSLLQKYLVQKFFIWNSAFYKEINLISFRMSFKTFAKFWTLISIKVYSLILVKRRWKCIISDIDNAKASMHTHIYIYIYICTCAGTHTQHPCGTKFNGISCLNLCWKFSNLSFRIVYA